MDRPAHGSLWRHRKRGTAYRVVTLAKVQILLDKGDPISLDGQTAVVYEDLRPAGDRDRSRPEVWVRPLSEFMDGHFDGLEPCPECHATGLQFLMGSLALMPLCPACKGRKFHLPQEG